LEAMFGEDAELRPDFGERRIPQAALADRELELIGGEGLLRNERREQGRDGKLCLHASSRFSQAVPQTSCANSTTSRSFASCISPLTGLPAAGDAKPHCGLIARRSNGTKRLASSMRRRSSHLDSSACVWVVLI